LINTNNTDAFDLDNYFDDADNESLNYTYTQPDNITISIDSNNSVSFIPETDFFGTRYIIFYANDSTNTTQSNNITLHVYTCGDGTCDTTESCSTCPSDCGSCAPPPSGGGGGGGGIPKPPEEEIIEIEEIPEPPFIQPIIPPRPKKAKEIDLTLISYPEDIDLTDESFVTFAKVKNTGDVLLENVKLDVNTDKGWYAKTIYIGDLNTGESKVIEIKIENVICSSDNFLLVDPLKIEVITTENEASDLQNIEIDVNIPELSILTDRKFYSEDDILRACIIFNNLQGEYKDKLEFELGILEKEYYILDYLSPYYVNKNKILFVTNDYKLKDIPVTSNYTITVDVYQKGDLFSEEYTIAKAENIIFLNGFIENKILQRENTVYEFMYENEKHNIMINKIDENFVDVSVSSYTSNHSIRLLEEVQIDLDKDSMKDISIIYLGEINNKADLRLRLIPKQPKKLDIQPGYQILNLGEIGLELRKPARTGPPTSLLILLFLITTLIFAGTLFGVINLSTYYIPIIENKIIKFRKKIRKRIVKKSSKR
jgi:hypothetical protein